MNREDWEGYFEDYYFDRLGEKSKGDLENALNADPNLKRDYEEFAKIVDVAQISLLKDEIRNDPEVKKILNKKFNSRGLTSIWVILLVGAILVIGVYLIWPQWDFGSGVEYDKEGESPGFEIPSGDIHGETEQFESDYEEGNPVTDSEPAEYQLDVRGEINRRHAMVVEYLERSYTSEIILRGAYSPTLFDSSLYNVCFHYFNNADFMDAIVCIAEHQPVINHTEASWLLALAHLGLNEKEEAGLYLDRVVNDRLSMFFPHARSLKKRLTD